MKKLNMKKIQTLIDLAVEEDFAQGDPTSLITITEDSFEKTTLVARENMFISGMDVAAEVLKRLGIKSKKLDAKFTGDGWVWSTMAYYLGQQPDLRDQVMKHAWIDHAPLPWQLKTIWAHHRYALGVVNK